MKLADLRKPVRFNWLEDQGFRLLASPYLSGAYEARTFLKRLSVPTAPLHALTAGHEGGIYNGPQFRRNYVNDREYGVPFLGSTDFMVADLANVPLLQAKSARSEKLAHLEVKPGMTLISCSGTVGRTCYARPDMAGFWSSQDALKVVANKAEILPGYLFIFLNSQFGIPMVTSQASGSMIQHLEPVHIADLPVPRFGAAVEDEIHEHVQAAAELRARFQAGVAAATRDLFKSAGLSELSDFQWHRESRATGFEVSSLGPASLRAMNYDQRARRLADAIASVPHRTLGEICEGGDLSRGNRFARIPAEPGHGFLLVGQEQLFWTHPEGRWVAVKPDDVGALKARDESIMVACRGLLTEGALIGRAALVTGKWLGYVYSEDLLRVRSSAPDFPNAYLFAFMRSEVAFRMLRSLVSGTGPQDINAVLRREVPVPECTPADRERIAETVRQAYRWRDEADELENRAQELLEAAVRDAAGADLRQYGGLALRSLEREADGSGDG
jgi:type I restriction enzyme S subunit